jgi:hypothetical protein
MARVRRRPPPADIDPLDVDRITEEQAWIKCALPGRARPAGALSGINVFLGGALWGLGSDGHALVAHRGSVTQVKTARGGGDREFVGKLKSGIGETRPRWEQYRQALS